MKASMSQQILTAVIALVFIVVLALVFSTQLGIPKDVIEFLKTGLLVPGFSAMLMAWKAWTAD